MYDVLPPTAQPAPPTPPTTPPVIPLEGATGYDHSLAAVVQDNNANHQVETPSKKVKEFIAQTLSPPPYSETDPVVDNIVLDGKL